MIHALLLAAAVSGRVDTTACPRTRVARVHLVDGMPFIDAVRATISAKPHPVRVGTETLNGFTIYDGTQPIASLPFAPDRSVEVRENLQADPAGRYVDIALPAPCARTAGHVVLRPEA